MNYVEHEEHLQKSAHIRRLGGLCGRGRRRRGFASHSARPEMRKGDREKDLRQEARTSGDPRYDSHSAHIFRSFTEATPYDSSDDDRAEHRASSDAERKTGPSTSLEQDETKAASTGLVKRPAPTERPMKPSSQSVRHRHGDSKARKRERHERETRERVGGVEVVRDEKQRRAR